MEGLEKLTQQAYELIWALRPHRTKGERYERLYWRAWWRYDRRNKAQAEYEQASWESSVEDRAYDG